jgi:hypothetical protein
MEGRKGGKQEYRGRREGRDNMEDVTEDFKNTS